jgi:hypothetical protein
METEEKFSKEQVDKLRDFFRNGSPEWLILLASVKHHGSVGNQQVYAMMKDAHNWQLSPPRMSIARKHLSKNGLRAVRTYKSVFYELAPGLEEQYARLFDAAFELMKLLESDKDFKELNRLQKRGKVKRVAP